MSSSTLGERLRQYETVMIGALGTLTDSLETENNELILGATIAFATALGKAPDIEEMVNEAQDIISKADMLQMIRQQAQSSRSSSASTSV